MTATAATEIDVLDFEAPGPGARWETAVRDVSGPMTVQHRTRRGNATRLRSREVGDLQLADSDCPPLQGVLSLGTPRHAERDVVLVVSRDWDEEGLSFGGTDAALVNGTVVVATDGGGVSVQERVRKHWPCRAPRWWQLVATRTFLPASWLSMTAVVRARRLAAVREELVHTTMTLEQIAHRWCFYDSSHLGREFRRGFGVSPSKYRESHGC
jgi:hypothetical protein